MSTLQDIREEYPQYADMSDAELADALYNKSYSDMDRADFDAAVGIEAPPPPPKEPTVWERTKAAFTGDKTDPLADEQPNPADDFDLPEERDPYSDMAALGDPYGTYYRDRAIEKADAPKDTGPTWGDMWHAGWDEYLANRDVQEVFSRGAAYRDAPATARGAYPGMTLEESGRMVGPGESQERFDKLFRARRAEAYRKDPYANAEFKGDYDAIQAEVGEMRESLIEGMQVAIDRHEVRSKRAAMHPFSRSTQETLEQETFFGKEGPSAEDVATGEAVGPPGERGALAEWWDDPFNIMMEVSIRSAPNMTDAIPLAVAGSVAGPWGFAAGLGSGSGMAEYRASYSEYMQKAGVNMSDARSIMDAIDNPELMAAANEYALKRGAIIGSVDMLTGKLATTTMAPLVKTAVGKELMNMTIQTGIQVTGGMGGEAGAIIATEGVEALAEKGGEVFAEGIGEGGTVIMDVGGATVTGMRAQTAETKAARIEAEAEEMLNHTEIADPADTEEQETEQEDAGETDPETAEEAETIIRHADENWSVKVSRRYPDGQMDVTITDRFGNTTDMTMKPGESFTQAVEIAHAAQMQPDVTRTDDLEIEPGPQEGEVIPGDPSEPATDEDMQDIYEEDLSALEEQRREAAAELETTTDPALRARLEAELEILDQDIASRRTDIEAEPIEGEVIEADPVARFHAIMDEMEEFEKTSMQDMTEEQLLRQGQLQEELDELDQPLRDLGLNPEDLGKTYDDQLQREYDEKEAKTIEGETAEVELDEFGMRVGLDPDGEPIGAASEYFSQKELDNPEETLKEIDDDIAKLQEEIKEHQAEGDENSADVLLDDINVQRWFRNQFVNRNVPAVVPPVDPKTQPETRVVVTNLQMEMSAQDSAEVLKGLKVIKADGTEGVFVNYNFKPAIDWEGRAETDSFARPSKQWRLAPDQGAELQARVEKLRDTQVEPIPPQTGPAKVIDPRLKRSSFRGHLENMANEILHGGGSMSTLNREEAYQGEMAETGQATGTVIDRAPSENPAWFQDMVADPELKMSVKQVQKAVVSAMTGKRKLGVRQAKVIQHMLDLISGQREEQVDYAREQLKAAREARQDARADAGLDADPQENERGEIFNEDEYADDQTADSRIIFEMMEEANALGVPEDVVERLAIRFTNNQEFMNELQGAIDEQRHFRSAQADEAQPGEQPAADQETEAEPRKPVKRKKLTAIQQDAYDKIVALGAVFTGTEFLEMPTITTGKPGESRQVVGHSTMTVNTMNGLINKGYMVQLDPDRNFMEGRYVALDEYGDSVDPMITEMPPGVLEDEQVYLAVPWSMSSKGDGDLYIQRIGPNAGTAYETRQGPNDIAITFNQNELLPSYMLHLFRFLQKDIQSRARGTAQQAIRMSDIDEALVEHFMRQVKENEQLELYLEQPPVDTQDNAPALDQAKEEAVDAIAHLRSANSATGRTLARDLAEKQRTNLLGQKAETMHDLAVMAQIYRDPRFEVLRVFFTDADGNIVAQVGLTGRLPASATALIGDDMDVFLDELAVRAKAEGASGFYMQHNHPSGESLPSNADEGISRIYAKRFAEGADSLKFEGHVILDHDNYSFIYPNSFRIETHTDLDLGNVDYRPTGGLTGEKIGGPADAANLAAQIPVETEDVVLILINNRHVVQNVATLPARDISDNRARNRRAVLKRALTQHGVARVVAVGRDKNVLKRLDGVVLDAFYMDNLGSVASLASLGQISATYGLFPDFRAAVISSDTSSHFDYLRPYAIQEKRSGMNLMLGQVVIREETKPPARPGGDLFGQDTTAEQSMQDEIARRDAKRNSGQESMETGDPTDLFSQASQQTDIEDVLSRSEEDKVESRRGRYTGRQEDQTRSQRIRQMPMEELQAAVFSDELTGAGNLKAYNEEAKMLPVQAIVDADSLKWVNDNLGLDAGDAMLVAIANALDQADVEVYRIGGDEFIVAGWNETEVRAALTLAEGILANQAIESPKGRHQGIGITFGIGRNKPAADVILKAKKTNKEAAGTRAGRGEKPPGATLSVLGARPIDMESGTNYVPMIGKHGQLPVTPQNNLVLGNGRVVRIPKKPVRREHILAVMQKYFGKRIYQGRVKGQLRLGFYRPGHGEIRLKEANDIEVAAHEVAHFLDDRFPWIRQLYMQYSDEMKGVSYDVTKVFEGYAEFMRLYFTQESAAMGRAPGFYDAWREALKDHQDMLAMVEDLQELMHAWTMQGARARGASKMGSAEAPFWEKVLNRFPVPFWQGFLDGLRAIKRIEIDLGAIGEDEQVAYEKARIAMGGSSGLIDAAFRFGTPGWRADGQGTEFTGAGLEEIFGKHWGDHDVGMYLLARRAQELNQQGRENLMRPDEVRAWLQLEEEIPELRDIHDAYQEFNDRMLDFYEGAGILGAETRAKMQEMNKNYVPFFRVVESRLNGRPARKGGNPFQRLKGGTTNVEVVWDNIIEGVAIGINAALINDAKRSILRKLGGTDRLGAGVRNQQAGLYAAPISADNAARTISGDQVLKASVEAMGITMAQYRMMKEMPSSPEEIALVAVVESMEEGLPNFLTLFEFNQDPKGNVDYYMDGGRKYHFEIMDPALMDSLMFMGPKGTNLVLQIMGGFSAALRRGVVAWPKFQTKNFVRDSLNAWLLTKGVKVPAARAAAQIFRRMSNDPAFREMIVNGGGFANRSQGFEVARHLISNPTELLTRYDRFMGRFENANRLAEYKMARAKGIGPRRAALLSREISTDFAMRGSHQVARFLAISVPFLNARMQGNYRLKRQGDYRTMAISFAMRGAAMMAAGLALYALNKDDERYRDLPEDIKDLYWVIYYGPGEDDYFLIPKPFEAGMLFGTMPERMMQLSEDEDGEEFVDAMLWIAMQAFAMDMTPQPFQPLLDLERNKDFTGAPIVPFYLENVEPSEQFTWYTTETAKAAGKALGISPIKLEHMINGYFGSAGTYALAASDAMIRAATDEWMDVHGEHPTRGETWKENIVVKGLVDWAVNEGPPRRTKSVSDLYDMVREAEKVANTMALMQKRQSADAELYITDPNNQFYQLLVRSPENQLGQPPLAATRQAMNEVRQAMDLIRMDKRMTGDEKRVELWNLVRKRNELAKTVMQEIRRAEEELEQEMSEPQAAAQGVSDVVELAQGAAPEGYTGANIEPPGEQVRAQ